MQNDSKQKQTKTEWLTDDDVRKLYFPKIKSLTNFQVKISKLKKAGKLNEIPPFATFSGPRMYKKSECDAWAKKRDAEINPNHNEKLFAKKRGFTYEN